MTDETRRSTRVDLERLRAPEWVAGAAGLVLLVDLFALHWYGGAGASVSGWTTLSFLRWLLLLAGLGGVGLAVAQAERRAPVIPVTVAVGGTALGLIALVWLIARTLDPPGSLSLRAGAVIGLLATVTLPIAMLLSLRREGSLDRDGPGEIPTLSI